MHIISVIILCFAARRPNDKK